MDTCWQMHLLRSFVFCKYNDKTSKQMHIFQFLSTIGDVLNVQLTDMIRALRSTWNALRSMCFTPPSTSWNVGFQSIGMRWEAMLRSTLQHGIKWLHRCIAYTGVAVNKKCLLRNDFMLHLAYCQLLEKRELKICIICEGCKYLKYLYSIQSTWQASLTAGKGKHSSLLQ